MTYKNPEQPIAKPAAAPLQETAVTEIKKLGAVAGLAAAAVTESDELSEVDLEKVAGGRKSAGAGGGAGDKFFVQGS